MSTRCQVIVKAEGLAWSPEDVMLYHHCDGYESYMLPLIQRGLAAILKPVKNYRGDLIAENAWQAGRPGKAAAWLCSVDPSGFEVESGTKLHGDIEYLYVITAVNKSQGSMDEKPTWNVDVYQPREGFWDNPIAHGMLHSTGSMEKTNSGEINKLAKAAIRAEKKRRAARAVA